MPHSRAETLLFLAAIMPCMTSPTSSTARSRSDVCIVGNGAIAKTAALGFSQAGHSVTLLVPPAGAGRSAGSRGGEQPWDVRVYALNHTAHTLLSSLKVWGALDQARVAPVDSMVVNGDGEKARRPGIRRLRRPRRRAGLDRRRPQPEPGARRRAQVRAQRQHRQRPRRSASTADDDGATVHARRRRRRSTARWWSAPTAASPGCAASATSASITAPTTSARSSPISPARSRTTASPTSGSPAPRASSRCCRCRATACRWSGRRRMRWPTP